MVKNKKINKISFKMKSKPLFKPFKRLKLIQPNKILSFGASLKMQNKWKTMPSNSRNKNRMLYKDSDGDRVPDKWDCSPFNVMRQDIRFGKRPFTMPVQKWEQFKDILNKNTLKSSTAMEPRIKMNSILEHDKELKMINKTNAFFRDDNWNKKYNKTAIESLKLQGYNDDDAIEFLANKNKAKQEFNTYLAQEMAKDKKIGHYFKGSIPTVPLSNNEGIRRMKNYDKQGEFIKTLVTKDEIFNNDYVENESTSFNIQFNKKLKKLSDLSEDELNDMYEELVEFNNKNELSKPQQYFLKYIELVDGDKKDLTKDELEFVITYGSKHGLFEAISHLTNDYDSDKDYINWKERKDKK